MTTAYDYAVAGNPMHMRTTSTNGTSRSSAQVMDLLGRVVRATDVWGTVVTTSYDSEDRPVEVRTVTAKGQATTTTYDYTSDGQVQKVTRDGQALAEMGYQDSTGRLTGADYQNGSSLALSYDANGNVSERTLTIGGEEVSEQVGLSPAGRTLSRKVSGAGTDATWSYAYDRDGRLTSATLDGSAPYGVRTGTWAYELNNASERTKITSPYTPTEGFTYSYAPSGAMRATSDTRFGNRFDYDAAGRATRAGPITLAYDPTGEVERISDGTTTESRVLLGGQVIATAITTPKGQKAIRYSSSGLMLTTEGMIDSQMVSLPGGISAQLPPPPAPKDTGGPAQAGQGTTATTPEPSTTEKAPEPATTQAAPEPAPATTPATTEKAPQPQPEAAPEPATTQAAPEPAPATTAATTEKAPQPEAAPEPAPSPLPIWRYSDLQGSVAWSATGDQGPSETTLYDPDGNRLGDPPALSTNPSRPNLLFEGSSTSPLSIPVSQMGVRSYVPALGIFLQPDPVPNGSTTAYNYAAGDPVNASDTSGAAPDFGTWWKENWGTVVRVTVAVGIGTAVGVLTAGAGSSVATAVAWGLLSGAAAGAASDYGAQVVGNYIDGKGSASWTDIDWVSFAISAGTGAVLGGLGGGLRAFRAGSPWTPRGSAVTYRFDGYNNLVVRGIDNIKASQGFLIENGDFVATRLTYRYGAKPVAAGQRSNNVVIDLRDATNAERGAMARWDLTIFGFKPEINAFAGLVK